MDKNKKRLHCIVIAPVFLALLASITYWFVSKYLVHPLPVKVLESFFQEPVVGSLEWNSTFIQSSGQELYTLPFAPKQLEINALINHVRIELTDIPKGVSIDVCLYAYRTDAPTYPVTTGGYSELMCWYIYRKTAVEDWNIDLDLSDMPLFLPQNTMIHLGSQITNISNGQITVNTQGKCRLDYESYEPGEKKYRVLRLPLTDQPVVATTGNMSPLSYFSSPVYPLKVKGAILFNGVLGNTQVSVRPCLWWLHGGGALEKEKCWPILTVDPNLNYDPPPLLRLDWFLPVGDYLSATCPYSSNNVDCAFYMFVEIPDNLREEPENIFRDYQNMPLSTLNSYCQENADAFNHISYFCNGLSTCDTQTKINNCIALFPRASCIENDNCNVVPSASPASTSSPNPSVLPSPISTPTPTPTVLSSPSPSTLRSINPLPVNILTVPSQKPIPIPLPTKCLTEGERTSDANRCCSGLKLLGASCFNTDGSCSKEVCTSGYPACSNCGDDVCKGIEDKCNCPADCSAGQEPTQIPPPLSTRLPGRPIPETAQSKICSTLLAEPECTQQGGKWICSDTEKHCNCVCPDDSTDDNIFTFFLKNIRNILQNFLKLF